MGESGLIVKYTEQDQWQAITGVTDLPLNDVFFSDENHGWTSGGYYDENNVYLKLFKTNDAGGNWQEIPDFDYQINDMFFENNLHGWAVGFDTSYHGIILETVDGGNNWKVQVEGLSALLNAIHFKDGFGWAVGELGLVLRTEDGGATWIDDQNNTVYPSRYELLQNYPNPFNPSTTIEFSLPNSSNVTLTIYNILGEEVTTLVSERLAAGNYQYEWSAMGRISSGIYLYRIEAGNFTQTRAMVLVK